MLRQIPVVGSVLNWFSPVQPSQKGRTFNLTAGRTDSLLPDLTYLGFDHMPWAPTLVLRSLYTSPLYPSTVTLVVPLLPAQPKWLESRYSLPPADSASRSPRRMCSRSCSDPRDGASWTSWFSVDVPCSAHQCRPATSFERGSYDWSVALDRWVSDQAAGKYYQLLGFGEDDVSYRISPFLFYQGHNAINMGPLPLVTMLS